MKSWNPFAKKASVASLKGAAAQVKSPKKQTIDSDNTSMASYYIEDKESGNIKKLMISKNSEQYLRLKHAVFGVIPTGPMDEFEVEAFK